MGNKSENIVKIKVSAVMTVEAAFVVSTILLIIFSQISFTLDLYRQVMEFGEKCVSELTDTEINIESMRLTRLALRIVGKD